MSSPMSEQWVGPGWWYASDGKWYPPHDAETPAPSAGDVPENAQGPSELPKMPASGVEVVLDLTDDSLVEDAITQESSTQDTSTQDTITQDASTQDTSELPPVVTFSVARPEEVPEQVEVLDLTRFEAPLHERVEKQIEVQGEPVPVGAGATTMASNDEIDLTKISDSEMVPSVTKAADSAPRTKTDRPASVTRRSVGPAVGAKRLDEGRPSKAGSSGRSEPDSVAIERPSVPPRAGSADGTAGSTSTPSSGRESNGAKSNGAEFWNDDAVRRSRRRERPLFVAAVGLAILSGVLGAFWLRERSAAIELRSEVANAQQLEQSNVIEALERDITTLTLQNDQLEQQLTDMSALVLELPAGRVTEIDVPLTPVFADEENGRLIAMDAGGEYVVFGEGVENPITDSGTVGAAPTGLFAATAKAWVSTDAGQIDILPLTPEAQAQETVDFGPVMFLAAEERGYWTFDPRQGQVVRLRKSDGGLTDTVDVPVGVVDLTIGAGSVWALGDDGNVYRINTADLTVQPIEAGEELISITAGPDALWTLSAADGSLRRIDPVTGAVLVTVPVGRDPIDATFAGSSVWVALRSGSSLIEVDTRTSAVVSRTALPSQPTALHQGDTGVYVTTDGEATPLLRIDSLVETPDAAQQAADAAETAATDDS